AAAADDARRVRHLDVTGVAGTPLGTAMEPPVGDDPGAHAGADRDDDDVVAAGGDAGPPFAEGEEVDVVVAPDRRPVAGRESLPDRVKVPAGHDRRRDWPAGIELDRARHADADSPQPSRDRTGRRKQLVEQLLYAGQPGLRPGFDLGRLVMVAEDPPVEAGQGDV